MNTPARPNRADISAALRADVTGSEPAPGVAALLAGVASSSAPAVTGAAGRLRRGVLASGAVGAILMAGVGASYAAGIIDPPLLPPVHQHHDHARHVDGSDDATTGDPAAGATSTDGAQPGSRAPGDQHTGAPAVPGDRRHGTPDEHADDRATDKTQGPAEHSGDKADEHATNRPAKPTKPSEPAEPAGSQATRRPQPRPTDNGRPASRPTPAPVQPSRPARP